MDIDQLQQAQQLKRLEEMKKKLLERVLEREAFERLSRVRAVNPQLAEQAEMYILGMYESGRMGQPMTDGKMREILQSLTVKREFKMRRV